MGRRIAGREPIGCAIRWAEPRSRNATSMVGLNGGSVGTAGTGGSGRAAGGEVSAMSPEARPAEVLAEDRMVLEQLGAVFARMSGLFLSAETVNTALTLISSLAAEVVPGTLGAGITRSDPTGDRVTAAATDEVVERADELQYQLGLGPCLTAWSDRVVVRVDDLGADDRWSAWSKKVVELGLGSSLSAPLVAGKRSFGVLKVYAGHPGAYGRREEHLLSMFATQAAMLLANSRAAENAERLSAQIADTLRAREAITLAKGIVMARDGVDERTAFLALVSAAQQQHLTVRRIAEQLARSTVRLRR